MIANADINLQIEIARTMTKTDGTSDVYVIPQHIIGNPFSLHLARMNRFNGLLNRRVAQWFEAGLFNVHLKWGLENIQSELLETAIQPIWAPLQLELFKALGVLYGSGTILSIGVFLAEIRDTLRNFKHFFKVNYSARRI